MGETRRGELVEEAFQLGVTFVHLPTLKPARFKTYASIRKSLTGHVSQGTILVTMANRVAAAGDAVADMRSECRSQEDEGEDDPGSQGQAVQEDRGDLQGACGGPVPGSYPGAGQISLQISLQKSLQKSL